MFCSEVSLFRSVRSRADYIDCRACLKVCFCVVCRRCSIHVRIHNRSCLRVWLPRQYAFGLSGSIREWVWDWSCLVVALNNAAALHWVLGAFHGHLSIGKQYLRSRLFHNVFSELLESESSNFLNERKQSQIKPFKIEYRLNRFIWSNGNLKHLTQLDIWSSLFLGA